MSVKENMLNNPALVTPTDYKTILTINGKGWVCISGGHITGFAIADICNHNIWALFVAPSAEKAGIGRELHRTMMQWYFSQTNTSAWLSTSPGTRAEAFYRKAGWAYAGTYGKDEIKFVMTRDAFEASAADHNSPDAGD